MKEFIAICTAVLALTGSSVTAAETTRTSAVVQEQVVEPARKRGNHTSVALLNKQEELDGQRLLDAQQAVVDAQLEKINSVLDQVKGRIGKTWYVFSGSTPSGWDCSGLVYWTYEQLGIEVPHSANKLGHLNKGVKDPVVGDIVVWSYKGSKSYYHAGIYIGDGKAIHAGFRKGTTTQIISLDSPSFKGSTAKFVRLIETH